MKRFGLIMLFMIITINLSYGFQQDSIRFVTLLEKVESSKDSALAILDQAQQLAITPLFQIMLDRKWAEYYYFQNETKLATEKLIPHSDTTQTLPSSKEHQLEIVRCYHLMNLILRSQVDRSGGNSYLFRSIGILEKLGHDGELLYECYNEIGTNYRESGSLDESMKWHHKAKDLAIKNEYVLGQIYSIGNLTGSYLMRNNLPTAKEHLSYMVNLLNSNPDIPTGNARINTLSAVHSLMGFAYKTEVNYDSALYHYKQGFKLFDAITENISQRVLYNKGSILYNVTLMQGHIGHYEDATKSGLETIRILSEVLDSTHHFLNAMNRDVGVYYSKLGQNNLALTYLEKGLNGSKNIGGDVARAYQFLGDYYLDIKDLPKAAAYYDSSLSENHVSNGMELYFKDDYMPSINSLAGLVRIEMIKPNPNPAIVDDLKSRLEGILANQFTIKSNREFVEGISKVLEVFYDFYFSRLDDDRSRYLEELWQLSETNKAIKLREQLRSEYSLTYSIPQELLDEEDQLRDSINQVMAGVAPGQFDSTLFQLNRKYDTLISKFEEDFPRYHTLKYSDRIVHLDQKRSNLLDHEVLLNFFQGNESIYLMKLSREEVEVQKLDRKEIATWIDQMNESLLSSDTEKLTELSRKIKTACLLANLQTESVRHIYIIPDGHIWQLNFAIITDSEKNFLGNQVSLSFDYFSRSEELQDLKSENQLLAFSYNKNEPETVGATYLTLRDFSEDLPGTSKEVAAISSLWEGDYFYGSEASETTFKDRGENYAILHLAVHGFQDEVYPENSYLKFSSADSLNDGRLYAYELYNLNLNAQLAVLSACHSGEGKIVTGEGMMSMGRSFAYAGVRSLLASRWQVPDISAPFLMKYFYQGLKDGMRKSEALRYAQIEFLKNDADNITSAPFYWSGFYLIGNDDPINDTISIKNLLLLILTPIFLMSVFIFLRKRQLL